LLLGLLRYEFENKYIKQCPERFEKETSTFVIKFFLFNLETS